jgi:phosphoribosylformylglycinamidine (FGAM) synthase-like amidotransferase family enzyme
LWDQKQREETLQLGQSKSLCFFPGGFSFADHFGAGRLAAYRIRDSGLWDYVLQKKFSFWGVCNGFQILMHLRAFGDEWSLQANSKHQGFINRWVQCRMDQHVWKLSVRHGEGRLVLKESVQNQENDSVYAAKCFLKYEDDQFENGSWHRCAGLKRIMPSGNRVIGMMPHPEILGLEENSLVYAKQLLDWSIL